MGTLYKYNHYRGIKTMVKTSSRDSNLRPCASDDETTLLALFFRRPRPGEVAVK